MNEHKNIITIEDEIKEFSDKPVKSSALFKALEEKGVPDVSEASAGDVLSLDEDKKPTWAAPSAELPDIHSGDAGKVLKVNAGETGTEWGEAGGSASTIGHPTIFLRRNQNKANGATNGELYTALGNYNSNNYSVFITVGDSNKEVIMPLTLSFSSGNPRKMIGTGMNYSSISGTTLTIKIYEVTVTIDNNLAEYEPNLTLTETSKTITLNS